MTMIDLLTKPELVKMAWDYFRNVQTRETKYEPLIRAQDTPAIHMNKERMAKHASRCASATTTRRSTRPTWSSWGSSTRQ